MNLRFLDTSKDRVGDATVFEVLTADLVLDDVQYLAYDGSFYRVNAAFAERVNSELQGLSMADLDLPEYRGEVEKIYNERVGETCRDRFVVLDRQLMRLPGESAVELCDLVHLSGDLIHVKRKGRSSTLSHLFFQATTSCALLRREPAARDWLIDRISSSDSDALVIDSVIEALRTLNTGGQGMRVVFAFLGDWRGRGLDSLPLFSRVAMVQASRQLRQLGFEPAVALVRLPEPRNAAA